jgi:hypothetical protein
MTREAPALVGGRSPGRGFVRTGVSRCPRRTTSSPDKFLARVSHTVKTRQERRIFASHIFCLTIPNDLVNDQRLERLINGG